MKRVEALRDRAANHILYKRLASKLSTAEFDQLVSFIEDNDELDQLAFEYKASRLFLDGPKPKHFSVMIELLHVCNIAAHRD